MADAANTLDTSALWDRYRDALFYYIRRKGNKELTDMGLQLVTEPLDANWHEQAQNLGFLANQVSKYGSLYDRQPQITIPRQYESFLSNLDVLKPTVSATVQSSYTAVKRELAQLNDDLENAQLTCSSDFEQLAGAVNLEYALFEKQYCPDIESVAFKQLLVKGRLQEFKTAVSGPMVDVLNAFDDVASDKSRAWTDNGELSRFVKGAMAGQADQVTLDVTSATSFKETRVWTKKKSSGFLFFKKKSSDSRTEVRFNSEHFTMSIQAAGFGAIRVNPKGNWFNPALVYKYKSTDFWKNKNMSFFGDNGSMPLYPSVYYVMYKPKVVLNVSKQDGYFFESHKESSFTFGPFQSKKGSTMKVDKVNENNTRVEFSTNSDDPQIVAIEVNVF